MLLHALKSDHLTLQIIIFISSLHTGCRSKFESNIPILLLKVWWKVGLKIQSFGTYIIGPNRGLVKSGCLQIKLRGKFQILKGIYLDSNPGALKFHVQNLLGHPVEYRRSLSLTKRLSFLNWNLPNHSMILEILFSLCPKYDLHVSLHYKSILTSHHIVTF